jgi:hypothetical protein
VPDAAPAEAIVDRVGAAPPARARRAISSGWFARLTCVRDDQEMQT